MKAYVYKSRYRNLWFAEADIEPGNAFTRYRLSFLTWQDAISWALKPYYLSL